MNSGFEYREQIGPKGAGLTVLDYLSNRYRHSSVAVWSDRIARGEVLVDGSPASAPQVLRGGSWLTWHRPPWSEPDVPLGFALLYRDADLLAVAKPAGLPTVPSGGYLDHTLLHQVQRRYPEASPLHRLGRGTSGLVLFARTGEARRGLTAAWRRGEVQKVYRALVSGRPDRDAFSVTVPIGRVDHPLLGSVHAATASGRAATSHVRVLGLRGPHSLVEVTIPTGRPHQIRIHLAAAGHPLAGDPLYKVGGGPDPTGRPGDIGYRLHAHRLSFLHPATGQSLRLECPFPSDLLG